MDKDVKYVPNRWIHHRESKTINWTEFVREYYICSDCGSEIKHDVKDYKFCPICGYPKLTIESE